MVFDIGVPILGAMDSRPPHAGDLRIGRVSLANHVYHVTTTTRDRAPVFTDFDSARTLIRCLRHESCAGRCDTIAFVVMPDHLHWLLQLAGPASLSRCVNNVKAQSARLIGRRLWQKGFHDHAMRQDENLRATARYIIANPVRAGLVRSVRDYPHWDAAWL